MCTNEVEQDVSEYLYIYMSLATKMWRLIIDRWSSHQHTVPDSTLGVALNQYKTNSKYWSVISFTRKSPHIILFSLPSPSWSWVLSLLYILPIFLQCCSKDKVLVLRWYASFSMMKISSTIIIHCAEVGRVHRHQFSCDGLLTSKSQNFEEIEILLYE